MGIKKALFDDPKAIKDDYICVECNLVLYKAVKAECGHRFCRECMEKIMERYKLL